MNALSHVFSARLLEQLGWTILHSLWQFLVIGALVGFLLSALRRRTSNLRYLVASLGLAAMLAGCMVTFFMAAHRAVTEGRNPMFRENEPIAVAVPQVVVPDNEIKLAESEAVSGPTYANQWPAVKPAKAPSADRASPSFISALAIAFAPWLPWISFAWLSGVLVLSLWNLGGWIGVQRLTRRSTLPIGPPYIAVANALMERMKISRPVRIVESMLVQVPVVVGWLRPVILLPASLLAEMSPQQLEAILAHELAHIRRHDYLVNLVQTVAETLLFYHPAVWWISKHIRTEREHCCDDWAVRVCGDKIGLSEALTIVAASRLSLQPAMAISGNRSSGALHRVQRLLSPTTDSDGCSKASVAAAVLVSLGLIVVGNWAQLATAERTSAAETTTDSSEKTTAEEQARSKLQQADSKPDTQETNPKSTAIETDFEKFKKEVGDPKISDPQKIHVALVEELILHHWKWIIYLPKGEQYRINAITENIPEAGVPDAASLLGYMTRPLEVAGTFPIDATVARAARDRHWFLDVNWGKPRLMNHIAKPWIDKLESFELKEEILGTENHRVAGIPLGTVKHTILKSFLPGQSIVLLRLQAMERVNSQMNNAVKDGMLIWLSPEQKKEIVKDDQNKATDNILKPIDPSSGVLLRGKEALIRVVRQQPAWGEEVEGLQIGLSLLGDKKKFKSNERVPLGFYIRNNSDKPAELTCYRAFINGDLAPDVFDAKGDSVGVNRSHYSGQDPTYDVILAPRETIVCEHSGLNLAEIDKPQDGRYSTEQRIHILIRALGDQKIGKWTKFGTDKVYFEIDVAAAEDAPARIGAEEKPVGDKPRAPAAPDDAAMKPAASVDARLLGIEGGKPPMKFYDLELRLENNADAPKWFIFPDYLEEKLPQGGVFSTEEAILQPFQASRFEGKNGAAVDVKFFNGVGFRAFRLPGKGKLGLARFRLSTFKEQKFSKVDVLVADDIVVNGRTPLEKWLPYETQSGQSVDLTEDDLKGGGKNLDYDEKVLGSRTDYPKEKVKEVKAVGIEVVRVEFVIDEAVLDARVDPTKEAVVPPDHYGAMVYRGKAAIARAEKMKPAWGKEENVVQIGLARLAKGEKLRPGERMPLEFYIRNNGKKAISIEYLMEHYGFEMTPTVLDTKGGPVRVDGVQLLGTRALYRDKLEPGDIIVRRHVGLGIGARPANEKNIWHPFVVYPRAGKFTVRQPAEFTISAIDDDPNHAPHTHTTLTTGDVSFEVIMPAAE